MKLHLSKNWIDYIKPAIFLLLAVFIIWKVPIFLRPDNLITLIPQAAVIGIASIGMSMVILSGEIDISVGAMLYCSGAIASETFMGTRSLILASLAAVASGIVFGLANGLGVAKLKIPSMITTLAVSYILTGLGSILIGSESTLVAGEDYKALSQTKILGMASNAWAFVVLFVIFAVIINKTRFGRHIYAIGDNADALRASGVNADGTLIAVFVLTGALCGVGGLLTTSRLGGTQFNMSLGSEVYCIAAVVVGGIRMGGGKGSIFGSLLGILMVASLDNILRLTHISVYLYNLVWGVVIFIIVLIDILKKKQRIWNDVHAVPK